MKSKNSLLLGQGLLTIFIIVTFGLIIVNEKGLGLFSKKIDKKIDNYIEEKYSSLSNSTTVSSLTIKKNIAKKKVISKQNKNHYFEVSFKESKISDTYKKDYLEGNNLLKYISNNLQKEVLNKTNNSCKIVPLSSLNDYSKKVQERIIEEDNLLSLRFYYLEQELLIDDWNSNTIANEIINSINNYKNNNITPKYFVFIITKKDDITTSIKISYITELFLELKNPDNIINDIINNQESPELREHKIEYKYL